MRITIDDKTVEELKSIYEDMEAATPEETVGNTWGRAKDILGHILNSDKKLVRIRSFVINTQNNKEQPDA